MYYPTEEKEDMQRNKYLSIHLNKLLECSLMKIIKVRKNNE